MKMFLSIKMGTKPQERNHN